MINIFGDQHSIQNMNKALEKRENRTIQFVKRHIDSNVKILDLGVENQLGERLTKAGYIVTNTRGEDLDIEFDKYDASEYDCVTAFEIFEHLMAPYNILKSIKSKYLVASVPLNLWFTNSYWNEKDPWDRHYHEFEQRQFDMLLERTGWKILDSERWRSNDPLPFGIRPLLRKFTDRYYIVFCENKKL